MSASSPSRRRRPLTFRLKLLLTGIGLCIGIGVLEIVLRLAGVSAPVPYAPDPWCGSRLQPNFRGYWSKEGQAVFTTNSLGFRDREHLLAKPKGTLRIAVLGDSYIEALQVADDRIFARCLEAELLTQRPADADSVEVLSFGVSGWGTAQELLVLRHYVWQFDPDVVLLAFLSSNDVRNNSKLLEPMQCRPFFQLQDNRLILDDSFQMHPDYLTGGKVSTQWKNRIINSSRTIQLVRAVRDRNRESTVPQETGKPPAQYPGSSDKSDSVMEAGLEETAMVAPKTAEWRDAWELTDRLILQMADEVHQRRRMFAVMTIPAAVQVDPDPKKRSSLQSQLQVPDLEYAERRMSDLATQQDFLHIPLVQQMKDIAEHQHVFLHGFANTRPGSGHWNENGHREAAKIAATKLAPLLTTK